MKGGPDMNKEDKLQRLLRLKRHEQPPEGFAQEFLDEFQRRQRAELMRRSALSIMGERLQAWLEGLRRPAVIWSAVGVYGAVLLTLWLLPRPAPHVTMIVGGSDNGYAPPVNYTSGQPQNTPVSTGSNVPGKRRTTSQEQDKEAIIGPKEKKSEPPAVPLREL
jgi:hypothetical protein